MDVNAPVTAAEQNQKWLEELKKLTVNEQLEKINERSKNDASESAKVNTPKFNPNVYPLLVVDGIPIDILNSKEITKLTKKLSKEEKVGITIMDGKAQSGPLFCRPSSGVILIQTSRKGEKKKNKE